MLDIVGTPHLPDSPGPALPLEDAACCLFFQFCPETKIQRRHHVKRKGTVAGRRQRLVTHVWRVFPLWVTEALREPGEHMAPSYSFRGTREPAHQWVELPDIPSCCAGSGR